MQPAKRGRPKGATTYDSVIAEAFGSVVREARTAKGMSQEAFAAIAGIERSHVGKIERGRHMPNLVAVFKMAKALDCDAFELVANAQACLPEGYQPQGTSVP